MSSRKPRLTIFSKLLIVILIVAPIAYFGATYMQTGEFKIENPFKKDESAPTPSTDVKPQPSSPKPNSNQADQTKIIQLEQKVNSLEQKIKILEVQVKTLQSQK